MARLRWCRTGIIARPPIPSAITNGNSRYLKQRRGRSTNCWALRDSSSLSCPHLVIKRCFSIRAPLLVTSCAYSLVPFKNLRSDLPEGGIALRSWFGERTRILHGQTRTAEPTRYHVCGNHRGAETPLRSDDRAVGNIEKKSGSRWEMPSRTSERPSRRSPLMIYI